MFILHLPFFFLYLRNNQVKNDEIGRACSTKGEKENAYKILVGKPEGNRPLERKY
jgi:hypothetical protein